MLAQVGLAATMVEKATEERMELFSKVEETGREVAQMRLEQKGKELGESFGGSGIIYIEPHLDVAPRWMETIRRDLITIEVWRGSSRSSRGRVGYRQKTIDRYYLSGRGSSGVA